MFYIPQVAVLQKLRAFDADKFNFVKFNDCFTVGKYIYIEFEKLEQDLCDFVESKANNRLSLGEIRPILHQVCATFVYITVAPQDVYVQGLQM